MPVTYDLPPNQEPHLKRLKPPLPLMIPNSRLLDRTQKCCRLIHSQGINLNVLVSVHRPEGVQQLPHHHSESRWYSHEQVHLSPDAESMAAPPVHLRW